MAADLGTAYIKIAPNMSGIQGKVASGFKGVGSTIENQISGELSKGGGKLSAGMGALIGAVGGFASSLASSAIGAISALSGEMIEASDSAQKFGSTLQFAGVDDKKIKQLTDSTQNYADQTVYGLSDIRNITAQLAANGVPNFDRLAEAAGNLNAIAGGTAETYKSVGMVLTQTAGQGKLTTENWNQLSDAIPGASGKLQQALKEAGAYTGNFRDAMAKGEITSQEFNDALLNIGFDKTAVDAAKSTQTIEGAWGNLQASVVKVGAGLLDKVKPYVTEAMGSIGDIITNSAEPISDVLGDALSVIGEIAKPLVQLAKNVLPPINNMIKAILPPIQNLIGSLLPPLQKFITQIVPPISSIVNVITQVVTAIVTNLVPPIQNLLSTILPPIIDFITGTLVPNMQKVAKVCSDVINAILPAIKSAIDTITGIIQFFIDLFSGNWSKLGEDIKSIWNGLWDTVKNVVSGAVDTIKSVIGGIWNKVTSVFGGLWGAISGALGSFWRNVVNWAKGIPGAIGGAFSGVADAGKNLVKGLWNGINDMVGWIGNKIKGFGKGVLDQLKKFFGIHSPSRVMRDEVGKYLALGMGEGITQNASAVTDAVESLKSDAISGMSGVSDVLGSQLGASLNMASPTLNQAMTTPQVVVNQKIDQVGQTIDLAELSYQMGFMANQGVQTATTPAGTNSPSFAGGFISGV